MREGGGGEASCDRSKYVVALGVSQPATTIIAMIVVTMIVTVQNMVS